jgi:hypothetical protein
MCCNQAAQQKPQQQKTFIIEILHVAPTGSPALL